MDGFDPPAEPWLPGNRGLTFGSRPGLPVEAVQPGTVGFAGPIAGEGYVTILLQDGRDTTYSYLARIDVASGDRVEVGAVIGSTGDRPFHLGYRDRGSYLDPTELVRTACAHGHAVLVPVPTVVSSSADR